LYDLAARSEYISPLREEIEELISQDGWKKTTIAKMRKLDSFLKESSRLHHLTSGTSRKYIKAYPSWFTAGSLETIHIFKRYYGSQKICPWNSRQCNPSR
jgi:hypothetical protein